MILMILLELQRKSLVLILIKHRENFIMLIAVICSSIIKKIHKFKADIKNIYFPSRFCIGRISEEFDINKFQDATF